MTTWGSRSTGSPTTSVSGISATRARIRSTRACWRALTSSRSATTAWSAAAAPSAAGTFSKPETRSSTRSSTGNGVRHDVPLRTSSTPTPAGPPHLCAEPAATDQPSGQRQPAHRGAGVHEDRVRPPRLPPRRPAGRCRPRGWPTGARPRRARQGSVEVDPAQRGRPGPAAPARRAATPARAGRRSARQRSAPRRRRAATSPSRPRCTASVPDEVNDTSSRRTPSASATASRALSRISRALRAGVCSRRGSAYPWSSAASIASRAAGCSGSEDAVSTYTLENYP